MLIEAAFVESSGAAKRAKAARGEEDTSPAAFQHFLQQGNWQQTPHLEKNRRKPGKHRSD